MKNFILIFFLLFVSFTEIFAAPPVKRVIEPKLSIGNGTTQDIILEADLGSGALNPRLQVNSVTGKWEFINVGDAAKPLGSGSGAGGDGGASVLVNGSMEDGTSDWTNAGGILSSQLYVNPAAGNEKYLRLVASGAGQYVEQTFLQWPENITKGCAAKMEYLQGDNAFDYLVIEDISGTPKQLNSGSVSDLAEWDDAPLITFPCPASGQSLTIRFISTAAGTIDIDNAYLGSDNLSTTGTYTNTLSLAGNGAEVVTQDTQDMPFAGSGSGWSGVNYTVQRNGSILTMVGSVGITVSAFIQTSLYKNGVLYRIIGNDPSSDYHTIKYTSKGGEFLKDDILSIRMNSTRQLLNTTTKHYLNITEQSSEAQEAYTPEEANFFIDVNIGGAAVSIANTAGVATETTNGALDMVVNNGAAKIPCSGVNASTGLTCSAGNESIGLVFNAPRSGDYKVCSNFTNSSSGNTYFRFVETVNSTQTVLQTGKSTSGSSSVEQTGNRICSILSFASIGEKTVRLFHDSNAAGTIQISRESTFYERDLNITVELISHNVSRPIIQNMVSTSGTLLALDCASATNNGTVSTTETCGGNWVTITRSGVGILKATAINPYSNIMKCFLTMVDNGLTTHTYKEVAPAATNSTWDFQTIVDGALADRDFSIFCIGER